LGDSSKNAVEGSLKANHLALHDLVVGVKEEEGKGGREDLLHTGLQGGIDVYEMGVRKEGRREGNVCALDTGRGEHLAIFLLWLFEYAGLAAQLTATTGSLFLISGPGR
jgi:hypothetical protein